MKRLALIACTLAALLAASAPAWATGESNAPCSNFYVSHGPGVVNWPGGYSANRDPNGNPIYQCTNAASDAGGRILSDLSGKNWPAVSVGDVLCWNDANADRKLTRILILNYDDGTGADPNRIFVSNAVSPSMASTHCNVGGDFPCIYQFGVLLTAAGNASPMVDANYDPIALNIVASCTYNESSNTQGWPAGTATLPIWIRGCSATAGDIDFSSSTARAPITCSQLSPSGVSAETQAVITFSAAHNFGRGQVVRGRNFTGNWTALNADLPVVEANTLTVKVAVSTVGATGGLGPGLIDPMWGSQDAANLSAFLYQGQGYYNFANLDISLPTVGGANPNGLFLRSGTGNVAIYNCHFSNCATGLMGYNNATSPNLVVLRCFFDGCTTAGIEFNGGGNNRVVNSVFSVPALAVGIDRLYSQNCVIRCLFYGPGLRAIEHYNSVSYYNEFLNNTIDGFALCGIDLNNSPPVGTLVTGNVIAHCGKILDGNFLTTGAASTIHLYDANIWYGNTACLPVVCGATPDSNLIPVGGAFFLKYTNRGGRDANYELCPTYAMASNINWASASAGAKFYIGNAIWGQHTAPQNRFSLFDNNVIANNAQQLGGGHYSGVAINSALGNGARILVPTGWHNDYTHEPFLGDSNLTGAGLADRRGHNWALHTAVMSMPYPGADGNTVSFIDPGSQQIDNIIDPNLIANGVVYDRGQKAGTLTGGGGGTGDPNFTSWRIGGLMPIPDANRLFLGYALDGITGLFATTTADKILTGTSIGGGNLTVAGSFNEAARNVADANFYKSGQNFKLANATIPGAYVPSGFDANLYSNPGVANVSKDANYLWNGVNQIGTLTFADSNWVIVGAPAYGKGGTGGAASYVRIDSNFVLVLRPDYGSAGLPGLAGLYIKPDGTYILSTSPAYGNSVAGQVKTATLPTTSHVLSDQTYGVAGSGSTGSLTLPADGSKILTTESAFGIAGSSVTPAYVPITQATALTTAAYGVGSGTHGTYTPFRDSNFALNTAPAWAVSAGLSGLYTPFRDSNFALTTAPKYGDANGESGTFNLTAYENARNTDPGVAKVLKDANYLIHMMNKIGILDANVPRGGGGVWGPPLGSSMGDTTPAGILSLLCLSLSTWLFNRQRRNWGC